MHRVGSRRVMAQRSAPRRVAAAIVLGLAGPLLLGCPGGGGSSGGGSAGGSGGGGGGGLLASLGAPSTAELERLHASEGRTPEGTIKLWLRACMRCASPSGAAQGKAELRYLTIPLKDAPDWDTRPSYRTFVTRLREQPHIFRAYAKGATPQNAYAADPASFEIDVARTAPPTAGDDRGTQVFLRTAGAESPRPVYVKQSTTTGLWYVAAFDNVYLDVKKVVDPGKETFK